MTNHRPVCLHQSLSVTLDVWMYDLQNSQIAFFDHTPIWPHRDPAFRPFNLTSKQFICVPNGI